MSTGFRQGAECSRRHVSTWIRGLSVLMISYRFSARLEPGSKSLRVGRPGVVTIGFHPAYAGRFNDTLELQFFDQAQRQKFVIHRSISATVGDPGDHEQLRPVSEYAPRKRRNIRFDGPIIRSLRPPSWTPTKWITRLPTFDIPAALTKTIYTKEGYMKSSALQDAKKFMPSVFNAATYGSHFQIMIYLEEEQMKYVIMSTIRAMMLKN